ncbi:SMC-Scp complex subunit ScpB, partial [Simiduia aestuariiviva]
MADTPDQDTIENAAPEQQEAAVTDEAIEVQPMAVDTAETDAPSDASDDSADSAERAPAVDRELLRKIVEGALLAAGHPLSVAKLAELFESEAGAEPMPKEEIKAALEDIQADCEGRGFELKEVGTGWRFQVRAETAPWVNRLWDEKPQKYSRALLETLALIAYRQPITRGDIEEIRGVAVSSHIVKTLSEREWIKVVGHRDVPGRPSLYATTRQFLDYFNLKSLDELPSLSELRDLDELNKELDLAEDPDAAERDAIDEAKDEVAEQDQASHTEDA